MPNINRLTDGMMRVCMAAPLLEVVRRKLDDAVSPRGTCEGSWPLSRGLHALTLPLRMEFTHTFIGVVLCHIVREGFRHRFIGAFQEVLYRWILRYLFFSSAHFISLPLVK
jgi:hypothetical protein